MQEERADAAVLLIHKNKMQIERGSVGAHALHVKGYWLAQIDA